MRRRPSYRRILLKLSGELLGNAEDSVDPEAVRRVAVRISGVVALGVETALVIGAGNIFRGFPASEQGMTRTCADTMGMLATVINALAMRDALEAEGVPARVQSAIPMVGVADPFDQRLAMEHLAGGRVVIFAAGTGHSFFTTDTTAALRACQTGAEAILKATKVDGVYSADPKKDPAAVRYARIAYADALRLRLRVMDATAFSLCQDNGVPIVVFDFAAPGVLGEIIRGNLRHATLVSSGETVVARG